jgi:peptide-methionine (S)-S-oxide reductase
MVQSRGDLGTTRRRALALALVALALAAAPLLASPASRADTAVALPPPAMDEVATPQPATEVAVLAGGCFWGVQGVYQHVVGVTSVVSGYAGGDRSTAQYETVGSGRTGHAEAVRITFDPRRVSYGTLLRIYFSVAHDPTELDRQGPDVGPQYRSAIFPADAQQARIAAAYVAQLTEAHAFAAPIVTRIEPGKEFFPAEAYHQDFLTRHPSHPYIVINDLPKLEALKHLYPELYRAEPVLVAASGSRD